MPDRPGTDWSTDVDGLATALDVILSRRSIREGFRPEAIPRATLEKIVECGLAAPSSKNAQPWRLHVVQDRERFQEIAGLVTSSEGVDTYVPRNPVTGLPHPWASTVRESAEVLCNVVAAVFIENCGAFSMGRAALAAASRPVLVGSLVGYTLELIGIGAAVENMWLAANALGVSAAFMGDVVIAEAEIKDLLGISGDVVGVLVLGYSAAQPDMWPGRRDSVDRVTWH